MGVGVEVRILVKVRVKAGVRAGISIRISIVIVVSLGLIAAPQLQAVSTKVILSLDNTSDLDITVVI